MRFFGLAEANAYVPLLQKTFSKLRALLERQEDPEVMAEVQRSLEELQSLGLEVKAADGLVDFRSMRGGELVFLCWKYPEAEIRHWHRLDAGFAGRKAIGARDPFEQSWAN
jgi:hypothetical protein